MAKAGGLAIASLATIVAISANAQASESSSAGTRETPRSGIALHQISPEFAPSLPESLRILRADSPERNQLSNSFAFGDSGSANTKSVTSAYAVQVSPSVYDFGIVPQGSEASHTFTITNSGEAPVTFPGHSPYAGSGLVPEPYSIRSSTCGAGLAAGTSCTVVVAFAPEQAGPTRGFLSVQLNESTTTTSVVLAGSDGNDAIYSVVINPSVHDFGDVPSGGEATKAFTVTNTGTAPVTFPGYSPFAGSGLVPEPYSIRSSTCASGLAVGASCSLVVVFTPKQAGPASGFLSVQLNESTRSARATLTGTNGAGAVFALLISPSVYDFGFVRRGDSASKVFTITNTGTAGVTFPSYSPSIGSGLVPEPYTIRSSTCGIGLPVGDTCSVQVGFTPRQAGPATGYFAVIVNESTQSARATITGSSGELLPPVVFRHGFEAVSQ